MPEWATVFDQFAPFIALRNAMTPVASDLVGGLPVVSGSVPPGPPVYMQPWFGAAVLVGWVVVPTALGYRRFERSDL
jgi:ABC-2 type transport system permease protein